MEGREERRGAEEALRPFRTFPKDATAPGGVVYFFVRPLIAFAFVSICRRSPTISGARNDFSARTLL